MSTMWELREDERDQIHVLPIDDLVEHLPCGCPCGTTTEPIPHEDGSISWKITHHSLDGREHREPDHDRANCPAPECAT